jgi:hypothetical protein
LTFRLGFSMVWQTGFHVFGLRAFKSGAKDWRDWVWACAATADH